MRVVCLFGERRGYEGDMPELMVAWDEYCIDANPEGFEKACHDAIEFHEKPRLRPGLCRGFG